MLHKNTVTQAGVQKTVLDTIVIGRSNPINIYRATSTQIIDILHTKLIIDLDWEKHQLNGLAELQLKAYGPNEIDTIVLDAKSMKIDSVWIYDTYFSNYKYTNNQLKIFSDKKFLSNTQYNIKIKYTAMPDMKAQKGSAAIRNDKGLYFINTDKKDKYKPTQLWTQGETESNSCWFPTVDKPNNKCSFEFEIKVPNGMTSIANGALKCSKLDGNYHWDTWEQTLPMSAYLAMIVVGDFEKINDAKVLLKNNKQDTIIPIEVAYYVEPNYKKDAIGIFKNTPEMISFFSAQLGVDFPWQKYSQVIARDYVSGAMENTSASLFGEFVQKNERQLIDNNNDGIVAHELFHQWFGDLVTAESWSNLVLNEGFATYGEYLWTAYKYGQNAKEYLAYNDLSRYLQVAALNDPPIVRFYYRDKEELFDPITYKKGGRVLNLLRDELGDTIFFESLKHYLTANVYNNTEVHDLRKSFEMVSGKDLTQFFNQWFYRGGHPNFYFEYSKPVKNIIQIKYTQKNDSAFLFNVPLHFEIKNKQNKIFTTIYSTKICDSIIVNIEALGIIDSTEMPIIIADAQHNFIGTFSDNKNDVEIERTFYNTNSFINKRRIMAELCGGKTFNTQGENILFAALQDDDKNIVSTALRAINFETFNDKLKLKNYLMNIINEHKYTPNIAVALNLISNYKDANMIPTFTTLTNAPSYIVAAEALLALHLVDSSLALEKALVLKNIAEDKLKLACYAIIAKAKIEKYDALFEDAIAQSFGAERRLMMNNYINFAGTCKTELVYKNCIKNLLYYAQNDERTDIKIHATQSLNDIKENLEKNNSTQLQDMLSNIVTQIKAGLEATYNSEKNNKVIGEYRKKGWMK
jgi:aminopeptidase N